VWRQKKKRQRSKEFAAVRAREKGAHARRGFARGGEEVAAKKVAMASRLLCERGRDANLLLMPSCC
jgi:hypothetical protein